MTPMDDAASVQTETTTPLSQGELDVLTDKLIEQLKTVFDPEIPVDIYELGLIYKVDVSDDKDVVIDMTLTAPGCPVAGEMPGWVEDAIREIPEIKSCKVELVFEPPWDPSRMSDEAKLQLNMF
jgi:FeS assembly SUF system protein